MMTDEEIDREIKYNDECLRDLEIGGKIWLGAIGLGVLALIVTMIYTTVFQ